MKTALHAVDHYENFPVASWLMPASMRPAIVAVYRFSRYADDVADEGDLSADERLAELGRLRTALKEAQAGQPPSHAMVSLLLEPVERHRLDWSRFDALLCAFEQDVSVHRYDTVARLADYCTRSANPVGQLVLGIAGRLDPVNQGLSDDVCTALQWINFLQDIAIDARRGRVYLPEETLGHCGSSADAVMQAVGRGRADAALRAAVAIEAGRAQQWLASGAALANRVGGRLGWELRAVTAGGGRILSKLTACDHDPILQRPRLGRADAWSLLTRIVRLARAGAD